MTSELSFQDLREALDGFISYFGTTPDDELRKMAILARVLLPRDGSNAEDAKTLLTSSLLAFGTLESELVVGSQVLARYGAVMALLEDKLRGL